MCLLLVGSRVLASRPLVVAANRDEYYDRPAAAPGLLHDAPRIVGGRDLSAGGTWLGVNENGLVAALTNRHGNRVPAPALPSRGLLCLAALHCRSAREAARTIAARLEREFYNPFNLLVLDLDEAWFLTNVAGPGPRRLNAGWHLVANGDVDDPADARVTRARELLDRASACTARTLPAQLAHVCRDHGENRSGAGADAVCVHRPTAGTRSSTILMVRSATRGSYWHADQAPCTTAYTAVMVPWWRPVAAEPLNR